MNYTHKTILNIIAQLETQAVDDPHMSDQIDDIVDLLTEDEDEAIAILESLEENELAWITPTFEELSFTFQSSKFIECIEELAKKFPDIDMDEDVRVAKEAFDE